MDRPIWINIIHQLPWNSSDPTMNFIRVHSGRSQSSTLHSVTRLHVSCQAGALLHCGMAGGKQIRHRSTWIRAEQPSFPVKWLRFLGVEHVVCWDVEVMQGGPLPNTSPLCPFIRPIYRGYNRGPTLHVEVSNYFHIQNLIHQEE